MLTFPKMWRVSWKIASTLWHFFYGTPLLVKRCFSFTSKQNQITNECGFLYCFYRSTYGVGEFSLCSDLHQFFPVLSVYCLCKKCICPPIPLLIVPPVQVSRMEFDLWKSSHYVNERRWSPCRRAIFPYTELPSRPRVGWRLLSFFSLYIL